MLGFSRDQLLSILNIAYPGLVISYVGLQLAQKYLPGPAFALSTIIGTALFGFLSQHGTNKAIAKVVGKERFVNPRLATSIQIDVIRGTISWSGIATLWLATFYTIPLIPQWLTEKFSWLSAFATGENTNSLLFFLLIGLLLTTLNGTYHLKLQKETQEEASKPQTKKKGR